MLKFFSDFFTDLLGSRNKRVLKGYGKVVAEINALEPGLKELSGEELAQRLAFRLMRLDAMRQAAAELMTRKRLGRDVFGRGAFEKVETIKDTVYQAEIFDLLKAYTERPRPLHL